MKRLKELIFYKNTRTGHRIDALEESITAFSHIAGIPVTFFSSSGRKLWTVLEERKICIANRQYDEPESSCMHNLTSAMNISLNLGEVYTFKCSSDLINLCYALVLENHLQGFLIAGPAAMGNSREKVVANFAKKAPPDAIDYPQLVSLISELNFYSPRDIAYVTTLFLNSINSPLEIQSSANIRRQRFQEQTSVSSKLLQIKKERLEVEYPYESEQALSESIRTGNCDLWQKQFSKYMEDIMVFEAGNLPIVKLRLISFLTQLLKSNDTWQRDYHNLFLLDEVNNASTLREMTEIGNNLISSMVSSISESMYSGSSAIIKKAVSYIHAHYAEPLTLKAIADEIHVSSAYLSALFRKETGRSTIQYLNEIRLSHGEELLSTTSMSMADIAMHTGFTSQSYFTKLFKEQYDMTPNLYRKKHSSQL